MKLVISKDYKIGFFFISSFFLYNFFFFYSYKPSKNNFLKWWSTEKYLNENINITKEINNLIKK